MKNFILFIILIAVCSNASDKWQFDYETGEDNFTNKQRWQTGVLNIVPGVGSYVIMDDLTGATVQWILSGSGIAIWVITGTMGEHVFGFGEEEVIAFVLSGAALFASSYIYNIYRSITYDKPKKTAYSENSGFNIAVLPNRNGKLNAFLIYNKAF